jgi:archaellum component FlaC
MARKQGKKKETSYRPLTPLQERILTTIKALFAECQEDHLSFSTVCKALPDVSSAGLRMTLEKFHRENFLGVAAADGNIVYIFSSRKVLAKSQVVQQYRANRGLPVPRVRASKKLIEAPPDETPLTEEEQLREDFTLVLEELNADLLKKDNEISRLMIDLVRAKNKFNRADELGRAAAENVTELQKELSTKNRELRTLRSQLGEAQQAAGRVPELEEEIRQLRKSQEVDGELAQRITDLTS